jgi:hypothetical protein
MEKTFYLDLKTLLEYLRGKSALLSTLITLPRQRQPCQGYIFFLDGNIRHGLILNPQGALLLAGADAYARLSAGTEWRVRIDTTSTIAEEMSALFQRHGLALYPALSENTETAPRQKRMLDMAILQSFPAKQRLLLHTVFSLINGERTAMQIKAQLHFPPEAIDEALTILRSIDMIE